jgi:predicted Rossmann-fold nucleotide-binding protein
LHAKPIGALDVGGYFDALAAFLDRATEEGFIAPPQRRLLMIESDLDALLDRFAAWLPPAGRWA